MPFLSFNNTDSAMAQDRMTIEAEVKKYSGNLQAEWRAVCRFSAQADVATRYAPGDVRQGSYSTGATAHCGCWLRYSGSAPEDSVSRTATGSVTISSNVSGRLSDFAELIFAQDPTASPLQPPVVAGKDEGSRLEAATLEYWMTNRASLSAQRPEVDKGGLRLSHGFSNGNIRRVGRDNAGEPGDTEKGRWHGRNLEFELGVTAHYFHGHASNNQTMAARHFGAHSCHLWLGSWRIFTADTTGRRPCCMPG